MNIAAKVQFDCLTENYITKALEAKLLKAKDLQFLHLKNDLLLIEWRKAMSNPTEAHKHSIDEMINLKYKQILEFIEKSSFLNNNINDTIDYIKTKRLQLFKKRYELGQKVADYVKTVLRVLDITWSIIQEFKYKHQKKKNVMFDDYYGSLVDALLVKVRILHMTVLIATYDDQDFQEALESLRNLLETRYADAKAALEYTTQQLKEYNDIGPEFKTLTAAYQDLLEKIQATKDDISRFQQ